MRTLRSLILLLFLSPAVVAQERVDFEAEVLPILEKRCLSCHRAPYEDSTGRTKNPKAGLRLDSRGWMLHGSDTGAVLVPGQPDKSLMYQLTVLPDDDADIMPAKGKPLTKAQTDLLQRWISEGADFGAWTGRPGPEVTEQEETPAPTSSPLPAKLAVWKALGEGVRPAGESALTKARRNAQIRLVLPDGPLLRVEYLSFEADTDDDVVAELTGFADRIAVLRLARAQVSDAVAATIVRMKNLTHLDLRETEFGDAGLNKIRGLSELRSVNLFETNVSDRGLRALEKMESLQDVYLFGSNVTDEGVARLREHLPNAKVRYELELPEGILETTPNRRRR